VNNRGFTLVELIIAMAVGMIVLGAVYAVFIAQNKHLANQEQLTEMHQNARIAMEMMVREISMAGYNPTGATTRPGIVAAGANSITFSMDITDTGDTTKIADGLTDGPNEYITYDLYTTSDGIRALGRKSTSSANRQPVVENVESLSFIYYDGATPPTPTAVLANIRSVKITIVSRTAKDDPGYTDANGHNHHHYTLSASCVIQNIGLSGS
jgi:type IV pilus assembly protein PilW